MVAALLFSVPAASAHDAAESTSPANGSTVATVPDTVSITFNNRPLPLGSQIAVNDGQGRNWADGAVDIVDSTVSQKLRPGAPAGAYTVVWRVVSSDSHPIEGIFSFTASGSGSTSGTGSTATAGPGAQSPAAEVPTVGTAPAGAGSAAPAVPEASQPFPWSIVAFAGVALALLVILGVTARRRLAAGDEASPVGGNRVEGRQAGEGASRADE